MHATRSTARFARVALAATIVAALIGLAPDGGKAAGAAPLATHGEYVPFVTDFPKPATSPGTSEPFIPFVTDFPRPAAAPSAPKASTGGVAWDDLSIGSGVGAALAVLLAGAGLVLARRTGLTPR